MPFALKVIVPRPEPALIADTLLRDRYVYLSRKKEELVLSLEPDNELSRALYPNEWRLLTPEEAATRGLPLSSVVPDDSASVWHRVYRLPDGLSGRDYQATLVAEEKHDRESYCQVVTGYDAEQLRPDYRETTSEDTPEGVHPTVSVFSGAKLGLVRLYLPEKELAVYRAALEIGDSLITVTRERLVRHFDGRLALCKPCLPLHPDLRHWTPAVQAHYRRWRCEAETCNGHYHRE